MARPCTVCRHADREAVDTALLGGVPFRMLSDQYGLSETALKRHRSLHIPTTLAAAHEAQGVAVADTLLAKLRQLETDARRIATTAEGGGDLRTALSGVRELTRIMELMAKLAGELDERPVVNVVVLPEWWAIRAALLEALREHPEARVAVASRLAALEATIGLGA